MARQPIKHPLVRAGGFDRGGRFRRRKMNVEDEFDAAFRRGAAGVAMRAETDGDANFLTHLFVACSPLAGVIPDAMLLHQAKLARSAHDHAYPRAMRRIVMVDDAPIGRIMIDWGGSLSRCVDVAILPEARSSGAGRRLLQAWIDVVDAHAQPASLSVQASNPARHVYARLGFVDATPPGGDPTSLVMHRDPRRIA